MKSKCLYCYDTVANDDHFHEQCSLKFFGTPKPPDVPYELDEMRELAKKVVERSISVPGVQPKLSMESLSDSKENRLTIVGALNGQYIFKPPSSHYPEMPENEHLTMRLAEAFGIPVVPSSLIKLKSGELSYITKRIDRSKNGDKIHMLDMFQITEAFDKYKGSYERIGKAIAKYSDRTVLDNVYFFDLCLFSFISGNNDMHLKNFSMLKSETGWILAPAYDLLNVAIVLPEDKEDLALTLCGKKKKLTAQHFEKLASSLNLTTKQTSKSFERMVKAKQIAEVLIEKSFLSDEMKAAFKELLGERYERLDLV
jgi:serine/threonine-protein kinase HipA